MFPVRFKKPHKTAHNYNFKKISLLVDKGFSWRQIGRLVKINHSLVFRWYKKELKRLERKDEIAEGLSRLEHQSAESTTLQAIVSGGATIPFHKIIDTRGWSWSKWAWKFKGIKLFKKQAWILDQLDKQWCNIQIARQHGKSSIILLIFILRKLCESVFDWLRGKDRPILYVSNSTSNCKKMTTSIKYELLTNPRIITHYGFLINREKVQGLTLAPNTANELRLRTLLDYFLTNFTATTPNSAVRGGNYYYVFVDDGVDYKEQRENPLKAERATKDLLEWWQTKIIPLIKGVASYVGTRYATNDIYMLMDKSGVFFWINLPAIIGDIPKYTIPERARLANGSLSVLRPHDIIVHGEAELLFPELWATQTGEDSSPIYSGTPIQNLLFREVMTDSVTFQQEYLNSPTAASTVMDLKDLRHTAFLPLNYKDNMNFVLMVDPASGRKITSDWTSMVWVGMTQERDFYIGDMIYNKWTGKQKLDELTKFNDSAYHRLGINKDKLALWIEVSSNRDFFNRVNDESPLRAREINPKHDRGEKEERILHNFGIELENGKVFLLDTSRSLKKFEEEIYSFPFIHPDLLDSVDQAIYILRELELINATVQYF